ncbi:DEDD exonuclease domain-containing protein [Rhodococcus sp. TAF43]|uniref:DEDD exonuclease domain-containing protein n=1 Tax=unclassified Rhodococcus (in: high G+C Gram-positive bacteria) TaxID=192944 RepID=UPI0015817184|nr:DEDD exonuclease domain-containing protein [Rhodococcus sp. W8901]QKT12064.1 DEDD exonuclease domain-containing protein [Rhodococcus sp. W8901]
MSAPRSARSTDGTQLTFDELDTPLREITFVVVDLETTGGSADTDAITEIGAVKVRGGEIVGELGTLIDPGRAIPPYIVEITGITTAMVRGAPRIDAVLPAFLEFARGAVLVAHNAGFDVGFLKAAAARQDIPWPKFQVLCTVKLARRVLSRDEAPSVKLSALATLFGAETTPTHRALDDAKATVDVLHSLIGRVGNQGVHSLPELLDYLPRVSSEQRAKRTLASHLPRTPGVYLFRGPSDEVLYVGTATDLRRRVRTYFTGSETRGRMKEMVALATRIDHVECAHPLEAGVRELRLLSAHVPPYNRRSKFPMRGWWVTLTDEAFPRLSVVRTATIDALGPFRSRTDAADAAQTVAEFCGLRTCTTRIRRGQPHGPKCPPRDLGGCPAISDDEDGYAVAPERARALFRGTDDAPLHRMRDRIEELAAAELFESAARLRDRTAALGLALRRMQRLGSLTAVDELIAARRAADGGWEFAVVRSGRLAAAGVALRGVPPMPVVEALVASAETVLPDATPLRGASPEEVGLVARWLHADGTRIVRTSAGYGEPAHGAGSWEDWCTLARGAAPPTVLDERQHRAAPEH